MSTRLPAIGRGLHFLFDRGDGGFGGSRDHGLPQIPCKVTACPCNTLGLCVMPSRIRIGADGVCEMAKQTFSQPTPAPAPQSKRKERLL